MIDTSCTICGLEVLLLEDYSTNLLNQRTHKRCPSPWTNTNCYICGDDFTYTDKRLRADDGSECHASPCPRFVEPEPIPEREPVKFTLMVKAFCKRERHVECVGIQMGEGIKTIVCSCSCHYHA